MDTVGAASEDAKRVEQGLKVIQERMPETYKSIQAKAQQIGRQAFSLVRRGIKGEANCFWACERGNVVGTPEFAPGIKADIAAFMVTFGCTFVVIWAAVPPQEVPNGAD